MKKSHRTSRAVFLFCFCCDARSMQATFADLTNANVCYARMGAAQRSVKGQWYLRKVNGKDLLKSVDGLFPACIIIFFV